MLPHTAKDNQSFHNLARELLPRLWAPDWSSSRLAAVNRHHPKDFYKASRKGKKNKGHKHQASSASDKSHREDLAHAPGGSHKGNLAKHNEHQVQPVDPPSADHTSLPDPIPDNGMRHVTLKPPAGTTMTVLTPVSQALSQAEASMSATSVHFSNTFSSTTAATTIASAPTSTSNYSASSTGQHDQGPVMEQQNNSHRLSPALIALFAVGAGFALIGILIMFKMCSRPQKRPFPIPSNPIAQDNYPSSDKYASDESPIFGGKDRLSNASNGHTSGGLWPWTQYHSGIISKPAVVVTSAEESTSGGKTKYIATEQEKSQYPFSNATRSNTNNSGGLLQPLQNVANRVASRLSTASMSQYPNSPRDAQSVGLAIDIADTLPVLPRSKITTKKPVAQDRDTTYTGLSGGLAYSRFSVDSPALPGPRASQSMPRIAPAPAAHGGGRARVKSSYFAPGSYPRASATNVNSNPPTSFNKAKLNQLENSERAPLNRSGSHRDRETRALTSALGLASPIPASPQPTLGPDDSLSVVGDREYLRPPALAQGKSTFHNYAQPASQSAEMRHRLDTPPVDSAAALGSLMLQDFGAGLSTSKSLKDVIEDKRASLNMKRADDKPPMLPSLAQMGLKHANPDAFADYRSPTYSIFLAHSEERKSKASSFGY